MGKRVKRIAKGAESIKEEIEIHFAKLEKDIEEQNFDLGRYHIKEIDNALLKSLEIKLNILKDKEDNSLEVYRKRLEEAKKKLGLEELGKKKKVELM